LYCKKNKNKNKKIFKNIVYFQGTEQLKSSVIVYSVTKFTIYCYLWLNVYW